jgi:hypothetical protein
MFMPFYKSCYDNCFTTFLLFLRTRFLLPSATTSGEDDEHDVEFRFREIELKNRERTFPRSRWRINLLAARRFVRPRAITVRKERSGN